MPASSIEEYLSEIKKVNKSWGMYDATTHAWYRGQDNENWKLLPTIYREDGSNENERELVRDFKLNASRFLDKTPNNELEWLFIMQHYGMSTRLLDWTENHLTALYFSVLNYRNTNNAVVWVLDGWSLNEKVLGSVTIPTTSHPIMKDYHLGDPNSFERQVKAEIPIAIRPHRSTPRIVAQKGVFTVHGNDNRPLEEIIGNLNSDTSDLARISRTLH